MATTNVEIKNTNNIINRLKKLSGDKKDAKAVTKCINDLMDIAEYVGYYDPLHQFDDLLEDYHLRYSSDMGQTLMKSVHEIGHFSNVRTEVFEAMTDLSKLDPTCYAENRGLFDDNGQRPLFTYARPKTVIRLAKNIIKYINQKNAK